MVTQVTSLGRSGLSDWMIQRVTAVIMLVYTVVIVAFFLCNGELTYETWRGFHDMTCMRVLNAAALISIAAHAWIGIWGVSTDYMTERMMGSFATVVRLAFQAGCGILLFVYVVWGLQAVWA